MKLSYQNEPNLTESKLILDNVQRNKIHFLREKVCKYTFYWKIAKIVARKMIQQLIGKFLFSMTSNSLRQERLAAKLCRKVPHSTSCGVSSTIQSKMCKGEYYNTSVVCRLVSPRSN